MTKVPSVVANGLSIGPVSLWALRGYPRPVTDSTIKGMTRTVTVLDAPTSAGAYAPGQEDGPRALRAAGLLEALRGAGVRVLDAGAIDPFRWRPDSGAPRAANADTVADRARQIADRVATAANTDVVLVLGGDCTVGVGTIAGLVRRGERAGLVYLDRHADLNVPMSTVEGALDWMGVAHMLDVDGAEAGLAELAGQRPMLRPAQLSFLGLAHPTPFEAALIADHNLPVVDVEALIADARRAAQDALRPLDSCDTLALHFDVDIVDFLDAPLAENAARGRAPTLAAAGDALATLLSDPRVTALTVTEFNPYHGAEDGSTTRRLVEVLVSALARTGSATQRTR